MDLVELSRRLENLIRIGTIHSVDHAAVRCRVQSGALVTQWLPWIEHRAGQTTTWDPPTVGEQCIIFSPSGEPAGGIVLIGIDSAAIEPPSHSPDDHVTRFPDGTTISYDHVAGLHKASYPNGAHISYHHPSSHLEAVGIITALVEASESITFDTPLIHITGQCIIDDLLTYKNGLAGLPGSNGSQIIGDLRHRDGSHEQINIVQVGTGGSITSNGKTLHIHHHTGVIAGGDDTGGPV